MKELCDIPINPSDEPEMIFHREKDREAFAKEHPVSPTRRISIRSEAFVVIRELARAIVEGAAWDKKDGYRVPRDCYNSYLYRVEDTNISVIDKLKLHGAYACSHLDGGSAVHINCEDYPTAETFRKLLNVAASEGCKYFCFNVKVTVCNICGYIDKRTRPTCSRCGSSHVDYATRVIGLNIGSLTK